MVGDPIVLNAVRSYLVTSHAGAHLLASVSRALIDELLSPNVSHTVRQDAQRRRLALVLRSHIDTYGDARLTMRCHNTALRLVSVLTARSGSRCRCDVNVAFTELFNTGIPGIQHGDGHGRGVNPTSFFSGRHALPPVTSTLVGEELSCSLTPELYGNETRLPVDQCGVKDASAAPPRRTLAACLRPAASSRLRPLPP